MKLDARLKGGLAWTGLFVVLAVPSADILFGDKNRAATETGEVATVATVTDTTAAPTTVMPALKLPTRPGFAPAAVAATGDPVDDYISSGKKLPDYISDGDSAPVAVTTPSVPGVTPPALEADPVEVASLPKQAPIPLPRDARPPAPIVATTPAPVVNQPQVARNAPVERFPLSDEPVVRGDQLEEWDSGSLADYLERRGLLSDAEPQAGYDTYDPDGFFLDEGPNNSRVRGPRDEFFF